MVSMIPGLFLQFPHSCLIRGLFSPVQSACRNLQSLTFQGIAVLTHHQKLTVFSHGYYCSRPFMVDQIPFCYITVGNLHGILIIVDNSTLCYQITADTLEFFHDLSSLLIQIEYLPVFQ